ncbi:MAG TPA: PIN domain-containing protein [Kineosporiaceae bacterium]|nr:PIN domain-containing protein [Kineosporiaceae bacterium]
MRVVADSHVLVWYLTRPERLTGPAFEALSDAEASGDGIGVAAVTLIDLWHAARRLGPSPRGSFRAVKQVLADASDAVEWLPLTVEVAERYEDVPYPDMKDPFDRIIVAAAWAAAVPLVTADRAISTSGSPVQVIW